MDDVREVRRVLAEAATGHRAIRYQRHARDRMLQRGVTTDDLLYVLDHPRCIEPQEVDLSGEKKFRVEGRDADGRQLAVVVVVPTDQGELRIITVVTP
ncbi:MAG: DUF4258 domain-containing protein [Candidatus Eisenbacteria bacterium]